MKIKPIEDSTLMGAMLENIDIQDDAYLGPFWYDKNKNELFGVVKALATDCQWYNNTEFGETVRTGRALHQAIWKKESYRGKDKRFTGDYRWVPRGRVFEFKGESERYIVCTGDWIDKYPEAKLEILYEFNLPEDKTTFIKNEHWDLGHGWSKEF